MEPMDVNPASNNVQGDVVIRRINAEMLPDYINQQVCLVGKVIGSESEVLMVESCDGRNVNVELGISVDNLQGQIVAFEGTVNQTGNLFATTCTPYNPDFDMNVYNSTVLLMNGKNKDLFYA